MGREIRMVPPNWEHPRRPCPHESWRGGCSEARAHGGQCYIPMRDETYAEAVKEWKEGYAKWESGLRPQHDATTDGTAWVPAAEWKSAHIYGPDCEWTDYHGEFPTDENYRPEFTEPATWFQVYQTVSEGSPVTPPFATREELIDYLATHGDFWDQARRLEGRSSGMDCGPWKRENAERFVNAGWAPSMMVEQTATGMTIKEPRDGI